MPNAYCMYKGKLIAAAPYKDSYVGNPHYVITAGSDGGPFFNIVVNSASTVPVGNNDKRVYFYIDPNFDDPICSKLKGLALGLYTTGFPKLDYWQDRSLLDIRRMRPIPYEDQSGSPFDVNDKIDDLLTIDETGPFDLIPYFGGRPQPQDRKFWHPTAPGDIIVYGFGFLFPTKDGLHETHMNQGNTVRGGHAAENGTFQDGAVIVQQGDNFSAVFTAFQSQWLPTDASGFPTSDAKPLPAFISQG